jgi:hypothetical protein
MVLAALRSTVAAALAPSAADDWNTQPGPVDAIEPPAYLLMWSDPWLVPATHCTQTARLEVIVVAARVDVDGGHGILEDLVEHAYGALTTIRMPPVTTARPAPFDVGGVAYLATRLTLSVPVTL